MKENIGEASISYVIDDVIITYSKVMMTKREPFHVALN